MSAFFISRRQFAPMWFPLTLKIGQNRAMLGRIGQCSAMLGRIGQNRASVKKCRCNIWCMDTQLITNRWTALVFGAVFNFITADSTGSLIVYTVKTLIGGLIWFGFQVLADRMKKGSEEAAKEQQNKTDENEPREMDNR